MASRNLLAKSFGTLLVAWTLTGCAPGFIYTNIHEPLSTDMQSTPATGKETEIKNRQVRVPLGLRGSISTQWASGLIGQAAKDAGLTKIYYADLHLISVLGGTWQDAQITIVGE